MAGAQTPHGVYPTSILDLYKVFTTFVCYEWAYGSTLTLVCLCRSGVDFRDVGVDLRLSDVAITWLMLKPPMECISHPHDTYTMCFSTLICSVWAYGSTLTLVCLCRFGVDFWDIGVDLSLTDVAMSWLRLKPPMECISHPYDMYTKCFSTLICYRWAYRLTLTLLCSCRFGVDFGEIGVDLSPRML
jgi:hypothetical protein